MEDQFISTLALGTLIPLLSISFLILVSKAWIASWVKKQAEHGFENKTEHLKTELALQSSLEISAHQAAVSTYAITGEKRVDAIKELWEEVCRLKNVRNSFGALSFVTKTNF